jgi:hypothetical protein
MPKSTLFSQICDLLSLQEARANYDEIWQTADELGFNMANLKAVGVHLERVLP